MKKFVFRLDTVLNYRQQTEEMLKGEHMAALRKVRECETRLQQMQKGYEECAQRMEQEKQQGIRILQLQIYESYLEQMRMKIRMQKRQLAVERKNEEEKKKILVEARKETAAIQKLKQKKKQVYEQEVQKKEEQFVEEFVSNRRQTAEPAGL